MSLQKEVNAINEKLNNLYNVKRTPMYLPHKNQNCAARSKSLKIWVRGRIINISSNGKCNVFFTDYGLSEELSWDQLALLDDEFCKSSDGVFKCSLLDVTPLQKNNYKWTDEGIEDFRFYTSSSINLTICIGSYYNGIYTATLFNMQKDRNICINAKLVDLNHCDSTGPESSRVEWLKNVSNSNNYVEDEIEKLEEIIDKKTTACAVQILNIISPGQFYVSLCKHLPKIQQLHQSIQLKINDLERFNENISDWTVQEHCFVLTNKNIFTNDEEWYRGLVTEISDENIKVFLRDKGISLKIPKYNKLVKVNEDNKFLDDIIDGVLECHLACLEPAGGNHSKWTSSATDAFKDIIETFEEITIEKYKDGEQKNLRSCSVLLYGLSYITKALSTQIKLENVNQYLASIGLCKVLGKIPPPQQKTDKNSIDFDEMCLDKIEISSNQKSVTTEYMSISEISTVNYDFSEYNISTDKTWQPANKIKKDNFEATAFYVDNNACVFFRDSEIEHIAKEVNKRLNAKFMKSKNNLNNDWKIGQACISKYHLDGSFYRAEILQIDNETCKVRFVDYGNIEQVNKIELRSEIICGNIPILINRYKIADMVPLTSNSKWSRNALDRIHALVVGKLSQLVSIQVNHRNKNTPFIDKCHIYLNGVNLVNTLIAEGFVKRGDTSTIKKHDVLYDFNETQISNKSSIIVKCSKSIESKSTEFLPGIPSRDLEEYEKLFAKSHDLTIEDFIINENEKKDDLNQSLFNFEIAHTVVNTSLESSAFLPKNTSSRKDSTPIVENEKMFIELKFTVKCFDLQVIAITSVHKIFIFPKIDSHIHQMDEMQSAIQDWGNIGSIVVKDEVKKGKFFLVKYKADGNWYRAQVTKVNYDEELAEILYIDYLNKECVKFDEIREYPSKLISYNLMNVAVKLHGVDYNPNAEQISVYNKLAEILEGKTIFAKIIKNEDGNLPEVDLYEKRSSRLVIYKTLIDNGLLVIAS